MNALAQGLVRSSEPRFFAERRIDQELQIWALVGWVIWEVEHVTSVEFDCRYLTHDPSGSSNCFTYLLMVESPAVNVAFKDNDRSSSNGELLPFSLRLPLPPNDRKAAFEGILRDPWLHIKTKQKQSTGSNGFPYRAFTRRVSATQANEQSNSPAMLAAERKRRGLSTHITENLPPEERMASLLASRSRK